MKNDKLQAWIEDGHVLLADNKVADALLNVIANCVGEPALKAAVVVTTEQPPTTPPD